jgi:hypothetical protein
MPGKHAAPTRGNLYRDAVTMVAAIGVVAVLVYLGLSALAGPSNSSSTSTSAVPTLTPTSTSPTESTSTTTTTTPTTTTAATPTTVAIRPPDQVRVLVLNSIGVTGLAGQISSRLSELGYETLSPDNYSPLLEQSRVWYLPGFEAEAFALAAEFPDALIEQNPDLAVEADIVVVLGDSYEG